MANQQSDWYKRFADDLTRAADDQLDTLRWVRHHILDRRTPDVLRLLQLNLSLLSAAVDYQSEADYQRSLNALDRLWWQPHKDEPDFAEHAPENI